ncbi:protein of unknown function DUF928 [Chroococcidiopsis thermalis PCC 7203]|jgi:hypothetical protein|uniref:DUF928 domain-containing protein n=1 Tax=Chroococcidiopsis thermalis (strain PCC 7203) TaxID=251229 RepID=K9U410_CHRTP|nr:protein of unknown function DUF928 [Chroococcidiopsis thermalis PCC 7203]PSB47365.1 DUF928 domain-containing protein [Cyanosarcina cf. burmensis CCALA 770]
MLPVQKIKLTLAISCAILSCTQVQAQPLNSLSGQNQSPDPSRKSHGSLTFAAPPPPEDIGEPGQRSEAGSRGCFNLERQLPSNTQKQQLAALVPVYSDSALVLGTTISAAPTFWFYTSYVAPVPAKFVLRNKDGGLVYQTDVALPQTRGIISLSLPKTAPPLSVGRQYRWFLKIYCREQEPPAFVDGWIQINPLDPTLKEQLEKATPRDRVALYAVNGLWFDALTVAAQLRRRNPNNPSWAELLQVIGLNELAIEPIVECCSTTKANSPIKRRVPRTGDVDI